MENNEIWRPIVGYEGLYEVSNYGRIRSSERVEVMPHPRNQDKTLTRRHKEKILKPRVDSKQKYYRICLRKNGCSTDYLVHRLVAETFIPNPDGLPQVNHKDENPANNSVCNLEWCSRQYNINYGTARERQAQKIGKKVGCFSKGGQFINSYSSAKEAAEITGISAPYIGECCRGKDCFPGGYKWRYL